MLKLLILLLSFLCASANAIDYLKSGKQLLVCFRENLDEKRPFAKALIRVNWEDFETGRTFKSTNESFKIEFKTIVWREDPLPRYELIVSYGMNKNSGGGTWIKVGEELESPNRHIKAFYIDKSDDDSTAYQKCGK